MAKGKTLNAMIQRPKGLRTAKRATDLVKETFKKGEKGVTFGK